MAWRHCFVQYCGGVTLAVVDLRQFCVSMVGLEASLSKHDSGSLAGIDDFFFGDCFFERLSAVLCIDSEEFEE